MKYSFHPYHIYYQKRAKAEIKNLRSILPDAEVEHFGSTAVPGLGGKGIIDLYVLVPQKELDKASKRIQKFGYEFKPSGGIPAERLFHQRIAKYSDSHKQTFHVHLTHKGNSDWENTLAFRDFLIKSPELAGEYSDAKLKAVLKAKKFRLKKDKKEVYMRIKKPVINKILKLINEDRNHS